MVKDWDGLKTVEDWDGLNTVEDRDGLNTVEDRDGLNTVPYGVCRARPSGRAEKILGRAT
jgi:hypothetical protein